MGDNAGYSFSTGNGNTLIGGSAGAFTINASGNTNIGSLAGYNTTGSQNTLIGASAGINITTGSGNIVIGHNANVPQPTYGYQIRMGNTYISYAGIQVAWTITSDIKWKECVEDLSLGLNVVKGLKPVDYIRKNNASGKREVGFIAQDVERLFKELGIENEGLLSSGYDGSLELRYNDFIPILTKAIQEQQQQIESYKSENDNLKSKLQILQGEVEQIKSMLAGADDFKTDY